MPVQRCRKEGKNGFKWGPEGVCFVHSGGERSKATARNKALAVGRAIAARRAEERSEVVEVSTADASVRMAAEQARFRRRWLGDLDAYNREIDILDQGLDPDTGRAISSRRVRQLRGRSTARLGGRFQNTIEDSVRRAHQAGTSIWGGAADTQGVTQSVDAIVAAQRRFASRFALDIGRGIPNQQGRMSIGARTVLWQNSIEGAFQAGGLTSSPNGWLIFWQLGGCFHCDDCPVISINNPYTRNTLPTFPRSGETNCRQNCCCFLEYRRSKVAEVEPRPEGTLSDRVLKPQRVPPGKRLPTRDEQIRLWDMEARLNHARRQISLTEGATQTKWVRARRTANQEIISFTKGTDIHHVPTFGVKRDVLTGRDVTPGDISNLTHIRGIDGTTISRASGRAVQGAVAEAERDLGSLLRQVGEAVTGTEPLPGGPAGPVVNLIGDGVPATLRAHLAAVRVLAAERFEVEFGPLDSDWADLVMAAGSWVVGDSEEVTRFLKALSRKASFAPAFWQERG